MKLPEIKVTHAAVKVANVEKSSEFFQKALGIKQAWKAEDWGMLKSSGSTLALIEANTEVHPPHIGFVVPTREDVDRMYEHLKSLGIQDLHPPKDHRDKSRSFYFKDPDGNQFELLWLPEHLTR